MVISLVALRWSKTVLTCCSVIFSWLLIFFLPVIKLPLGILIPLYSVSSQLAFSNKCINTRNVFASVYQQATTYIEYIEYKNNRERENRERESDFVAPTLADIISYSKTLGVDDSEYCERFYNHYEAIGWINGSGHRIKKWKLIFNNWCKKDKKIKKQEKKTYIEFDENGELIEVER